MQQPFKASYILNLFKTISKNHKQNRTGSNNNARLYQLIVLFKNPNLNFLIFIIKKTWFQSQKWSAYEIGA